MFYWLPIIVAVLVQEDEKLKCCDDFGPNISLFLTFFDWDKGLFKLSDWQRGTNTNVAFQLLQYMIYQKWLTIVVAVLGQDKVKLNVVYIFCNKMLFLLYLEGDIRV